MRAPLMSTYPASAIRLPWGATALTTRSRRLQSRQRPGMHEMQESLGHASVTTTQRYTHLEVEDLQAQVAGLPANHSGDIG